MCHMASDLSPGTLLTKATAVSLVSGLAQFNFGSLYDFDLASDVIFPAPGDEVTLSCRRTDQYRRKSSNSFLGQVTDTNSFKLYKFFFFFFLLF